MIPLLSGVRIVEVGAVVLGPYAGQILADLGAEVIKVEPLDGDVARASHPQGAGTGALFVNNNRNKRMIALDLKHPEGKAALDALIEASDVLLHNMRIDAAERLGLGFADVVTRNPRIIHCAAVGFGRAGRYRDRPALDDVIQAASGLAGLAAVNGDAPQFVPTIMADKIAALHAVYAILAALVSRANGHDGAIEIEVPMFEAVTAFLLNEHLGAATFAQDGALGYPRLFAPDRRPFRTADGWIAVLPYTDRQWRRFLEEVGREDVVAQDWFTDDRARQARIGELYALVAGVLPSRTTAAWLEVLAARDVPCSAVNMLEDLLDDPHLDDAGFFATGPGYPGTITRALPQPVSFGGFAVQPDVPAGEAGEDSRAILRAAGYDDDAIDRLAAAGVLYARD